MYTHKLVFVASNMRDVHVVSRRTNVFLYKSELMRLSICNKTLANFLPVKICQDVNASTSSLMIAAYIDCNKVNLGMTMLSGLGSRHVDDLARTACAE